MQYTRIELPNCPMTAYIPDRALDFIPPRRAIVICPGGGYAYRSVREAEPIALVFACMGYCDYNRRFSGKAHRGFQEAYSELMEMFAD